ncbi:helix-turn-helix transcriptional regulator [Streptomyces sp. S.PNR 29]|uniref:helix-turn-helix domain-containing protein n=1 Tax=Streptomyces sp. S.PNR 29 TaxID=2973805 RepID=UPI0025B05C1E|nr:helix-turn-helix transcriptional regulator [Streptomyces sp. S.PNR 29]MDN0200009.1 helix-turn-helix domain-containing protein [Streptomyces sp. S.PNR 29]
MGERSLPPDPATATDAAEYVGLLRALKDWAGVTYRQLETRSEALGTTLPRSTVANLLQRPVLPSEDQTLTFIRACGCSPAQIAEWLAVYKQIAALDGTHRRAMPQRFMPREAESAPVVALSSSGPEVPLLKDDGAKSAPRPAPESPAHRPRPRTEVVLAVLTVFAIALAGAIVGLRGTGDDERPRAEENAAPSPHVDASDLPKPGPYRIRVAHSRLCLTEKVGTDHGRVFQASCADTVPRFSLEAAGKGSWRIATDHPEFGPGCMGVRGQDRAIGASMENAACGRRGDAETFTLERTTAPARGFRLRPRHTNLCLGIREGSRDSWAEVLQLSCSQEGVGQVFVFEAVRS